MVIDHLNDDNDEMFSTWRWHLESRIVCYVTLTSVCSVCSCCILTLFLLFSFLLNFYLDLTFTFCLWRIFGQLASSVGAQKSGRLKISWGSL